MNEKNICPNYCGLTCVNGTCPVALFNSDMEYDVEPCDCSTCHYYEGCSDCCFCEPDGTCAIC